ncbi:MAG: lipase family protein [Candidatus Thiodiazotropha sp. (ex Monitilora ramsayi)]|nr:lipase family protein [Candidatus Thiodiazotropha sp. (ex Monitilora ramsayi)]
MTDIREVDADRIGLLIDCCIQAYNAFDVENVSQCARTNVVAPEGFELLDCWSGVDAVFGRDKTLETYGLVYRSTTAPWRYIFAFRGTDSALDMLDDCGVEPQAFLPFDSEIGVPAGVRVESGFNDIYQKGDRTVASMQRQLFTLIDKYQASLKPISEIYVTGHSLGAALSQLFTLDLALSRPTISAKNVNFASPRVGNGAFVSFFEECSLHPTLRVQNIYDAVPHLPPAELGFEHMPSVYLIAFHSTGMLGKEDLKASHSSLNYKAVINCAAENDEGICLAGCLLVEGKASICSERPDVQKIQLKRD